MIVLDTHAWVWWVADRAKLSRKALLAIQREKKLAIADISLWEVAMLVTKGRLLLDRDAAEWIDAASRHPPIEVIPIRPAIAVRSTQLGRTFHGDPADRLIVATALVEGARLVSKDDRIRAFTGIPSIW